MTESNIGILKEKFSLDDQIEIGPRDLYPELDDEQYAAARFVFSIAYEQFVDDFDEDGNIVLTGEEAKYLYMSQVHDQIVTMPEYMRAGLLAVCCQNLNGAFDDTKDVRADADFMLDYFELDEEVLKQIIKFDVAKELELKDGKYMNWWMLVWTSRVYPDIFSAEDIGYLANKPALAPGAAWIVADEVYYNHTEFARIFADKIGLEKEPIQHHIWETFVTGKLGNLSRDRIEGKPIDKIISGKYLAFFEDSKDLEREITQTISEFKEKEGPEYVKAIDVMEYLLSCLHGDQTNLRQVQD